MRLSTKVLLGGATLVFVVGLGLVIAARRFIVTDVACGPTIGMRVFLLLLPDTSVRYDGAAAAFWCGRERTLQILLETVPDDPAEGRDWICGLMRHCERDRMHLANQVLSWGKRRGFKPSDDYCEDGSLLVAAETPECAQMLLDEGYPCERGEKSCLLDLHAKDPAVWETLLKAGADPKVKTESGWTVLHDLPSREIAQLLVKYGANPNVASTFLLPAACCPLLGGNGPPW